MEMVALLMTLALGPDVGQSQVVQIPVVTRPPVLDDYVAEAAARPGLPIDQFRQREPLDGDAVSEPTAGYLARDGHHLYVAFVCGDRDPARIRARLSRRDSISQDDQVVLMLDTFHDRQRSYLFAVNPLGIQADAIMSEGRDDDYTFDTVWKSSGRLTANGFVVLMAIPFKSLRISAAENATWGVALSRVIPRNSEQSFFPYITRRVEGVAQQFATVAQPPGINGGRNIQLVPYLSGSTAEYLDQSRSAFTKPSERRAGLDAKVVVRDAIAIDVALNPDFSQVESDQPQVAINQRFELFYPEKRPFFLENAAFFKYVRTAPSDPTTRLIPEMLFFSRRIQDPQLGARVTGKAGPWSFGAIVANDRAFDEADGPRAVIGVGRVQREFANQSTIGWFVTSREHDRDENRVAALDLRWKLSPNWIFAGQAVASESQRADGTHLSGPAYNASVFYSSRRGLYSLFYSDRSPRFRTTLGFVPRVDVRQIEQYGEYRWRPRSGPVVAYGPNTYVRFNWNRAGELQEWIVRFPFEVHLKGRTQVFVRRVESSERIDGIALRQHIQTINVTTEWLKWLSINEGFEWGVSANYFPPVGIARHVAPSTLASLGLTFRPTPRLRLEQTYLYSALEDVFRNQIARSTFNYQFTRALSLRAIADYNAVHPNVGRVRSIHDERIGVDTLLTYQLGPSTAFYFGYTSGYQNVRPASEGDPVSRTDSPSTLVGRQVFAKLSYLIRR